MQVVAPVNCQAAVPHSVSRPPPKTGAGSRRRRPFTTARPQVCAHQPTRRDAVARTSTGDAAASGRCPGGSPPQWLSGFASKALATGLAAGLAFGQLAPAAGAADTAKVGKCLLTNCPLQLARCIADPSCAESLLCLQQCNGKPDEQDCQIKCTDLFEDTAVQVFNECAISSNDCVPQRIDSDKEWPVPPESALDKRFDLGRFTGRWYITAGLNKLFDVFPCQEHYFGVPQPGKLYGRINWRIPKGDDDFIERTTIQTFVQQENPAILKNYDNAYLNYTDDWYVLASKPDEYVLIYYKGSNDAWTGYGGATVYSRAKELPQKYVPEIRAALQKIHRRWEDFQLTDNTCKPRRGARSAVERIGRAFEAGVGTAAEEEVDESAVARGLLSFGRGFTTLENQLTPGSQKEQAPPSNEMEDAERYLQKVEESFPDRHYAKIKTK
jgi:violaxanthin de-epoxidase